MMRWGLSSTMGVDEEMGGKPPIFLNLYFAPARQLAT